MSRIKMMAIGFVLVMLGLQLNFVESYELTPRFTNFLSEHGQLSTGNGTYPNQPLFRQTSFGQGASPYPIQQVRVITPPKWMCWPVLFCGAVLVLQGAARKD